MACIYFRINHNLILLKRPLEKCKDDDFNLISKAFYEMNLQLSKKAITDPNAKATFESYYHKLSDLIQSNLEFQFAASIQPYSTFCNNRCVSI